MKIKTIVGLVGGLVMASGTSHAETNMVPHSAWEAVTSLQLMRQYIGDIVGGRFYVGGPMSFSTLEIDHTDRLGKTYGLVSIGQKLDDCTFDADGGNEYDLAIGRRGCFFEDSRFPIKYDFGTMYLFVHDLGRIDNDVVEDWIRIDVPIWSDPKTHRGIVQAYVQPYRFDRVGNRPSDSGWFIHGGLIRQQPVGHYLGHYLGQDTIVNFDYRVGWSGGVFGMDSGFAYHRLMVYVPVEVGRHWCMILGFGGQMSAGGQRPGHAFEDRARVLATLTLTKKWPGLKFW